MPRFLSNIDLNKNELLNARAQNLATAPQNPGVGQIYFNTSEKTFYGWGGNDWVDLGQVLDGNSIVKLINACSSKIENDNLSAEAIDAIKNRHTHSNKTILDAIEVAFTNALKIKLDGVSAGATKTENSAKNGIILINGVEQNVYTHPIGTNPHSTTKADVGLGNVENKSSATIRSELVTADINKALGFTPKKIDDGIEKSRPAATGGESVYIATDTKKIYFDVGANTWIQIGGQDTIDWSNVTNKPSVFTPPIATTTTLGGIKVGANLSIASDGTLNANDNPASFIRKQERFTVGKGQTVFNLIKGTYKPNTGAITWFFNGVKQDDAALIETSSTSVSLPAGLPQGGEIMLEYYQVINWHPFPGHANEHLSSGVDPIPFATALKEGLMSSSQASKLDGILTGATKTENSSKNGIILINGIEQNVYTHPSDTNTRHVTDSEKATWNAKETPAGAQSKADSALANAKAYADGKASTAESNSKGYTDNKLASLINAAPEFLNTFDEIAKAVGNDPNFATTIMNKIGEIKNIVTQHDGDNIKHITATERNAWNAKTDKVSFNIGDTKATEFILKHNLNTKDLAVGIEEVATGEMIYTDILKVDVNSIKVLFAQAPAANQYRVTIIG